MLALASTAAACGSDDNTSDGGGSAAAPAQTSSSTAAAPATKKATGTPIKMMTISTDQSPITSLPEAFTGAKAAANAINTAGGVRGQPIELTTCDDKFTPAGAGACARKAVADGVDAVEMITSYGAQIYPVLKQAGIPAVGNAVFSQLDNQDPLSYPLAAGSDVFFDATPIIAKAAGKKSIAVLALDVASATSIAKEVQDAAGKVGLPFKGIIKMPLQATDLSPTMQQLKKSGAESVVMIVAAPAVPNILKTAQALGVKTTWISYPDVASTDVLKSSGTLAEGMLIASPYPARDNPVYDQYNKEIDAAQEAGLPHIDRREGLQMLNPWLGVHALQAIGDSMSGQVNRQSLLAALKSTSTPLTVGGFVKWTPNATGPAAFPRIANGQVYPLIVKDSKLQANGDPIDVYSELGIK